MKKNAKCFDLCCGVGGLSLGFKQSGAQLLGGIDTDCYAVKTAASNFKAGAWEVCDLREFNKFLRDHKTHPAHKCTILLAGLPCQGFSVAGKGDPKDQRNNLYRHMIQAVNLLAPQFIVFENVSGILYTKNNRILKRIEKDLLTRGYSVAWRVLNAFDFGVPQIRIRLFLIASNIVNVESVFNYLRTRNGQKNVREAFKGLPGSREQKKMNHIFMQHGKKVQRKIDCLKPNGPRSYRRLEMKKPAFTIIAGHRALAVHPRANRSISVREAARLQGFPDNFIFYGPKSRQINYVANAVPPPVAAAIGRAIRTVMSPNSNQKSIITKKLEKVVIPKQIIKIRSTFLQYFNKPGRKYPWRLGHNPYKIVVTEILLQRTDRTKVKRIWGEVFKKCRSARSTSNMDPKVLRPVFKEIGLFSRGRTIIELSKAIVRSHNGQLPSEFDSLMRLPGIGLYIASAVRVFAFGELDFPVDSNAFRFFSRYFGIRLAGKKSEARQLRDYMVSHLKIRKIREFCYGFLDFMFEICRFKAPRCMECRLRCDCTHYLKINGINKSVDGI